MRGIKVQKSHVQSSILDKTGGVCAVCGRELVHRKVTIDHYIPKYHGGTDDMRNLLPLCKNCNKRKGSRIVYGAVDITKVKPISFDPFGNGYYGVGEKVGNAFKDGMQLSH